MQFHQLRYFEAVARLGSMAAAAAACHVSPPALSVQIRKLEEEAGSRLLVRGAAGVRLTPAGERTLAVARSLLRGASEWRAEMRSGELGRTPPVRLAIQPFLSVGLVPRVLASMLREGRRRQRLRFLERVSTAIPAMLRSGEADAALVDLSGMPVRGFRSRPLLEFPYALFAHASSPLGQSQAPVTLAESVAGDFLLSAMAPGLADAVRDLGREPVFSGDHALSILELVAARAGVAILPALLAAQAARSGVVTRPVSDYSANLSVGLVWATGGEAPAPALELSARLRAAYPRWSARRTSPRN
jgi:LysR family hydrogen peroxide-inducible transcriptional activator